MAEIRERSEDDKAVDNWAAGHLAGVLMHEADRATTVFERVSLMTDDKGELIKNQLRVEVSGRPYTVTIEPAAE